MKLELVNSAGAGPIQLSDDAFGRAYNEALVHQVVTAYRNRNLHAIRATSRRTRSRHQNH